MEQINTRDELISSKIEDLKAKKAAVEELLANRPKYKTNLMVGQTSCRAVSNFSDLFEAWSKLHDLYQKRSAFNEQFGINDKIICYGYTFDEWTEDFKLLKEELELKNKKSVIEDAIKKLDRFYSNDKRTTDSFNELLGNIENL